MWSLEVILQILRFGGNFCGDHGASAPPPSTYRLKTETYFESSLTKSMLKDLKLSDNAPNANIFLFHDLKFKSYKNVRTIKFDF